MVFCRQALVNSLIDPATGPVDPIRPFEGDGTGSFEIPFNEATGYNYGIDPSTEYAYYNQIRHRYSPRLSS